MKEENQKKSIQEENEFKIQEFKIIYTINFEILFKIIFFSSLSDFKININSLNSSDMIMLKITNKNMLK